MKVRKDVLSLRNGMYRKQRCETRHISGTTDNEETDSEVVQQKVIFSGILCNILCCSYVKMQNSVIDYFKLL